MSLGPPTGIRAGSLGRVTGATTIVVHLTDQIRDTIRGEVTTHRGTVKLNMRKEMPSDRAGTTPALSAETRTMRLSFMALRVLALAHDLGLIHLHTETLGLSIGTHRAAACGLLQSSFAIINGRTSWMNWIIVKTEDLGLLLQFSVLTRISHFVTEGAGLNSKYGGPKSGADRKGRHNLILVSVLILLSHRGQPYGRTQLDAYFSDLSTYKLST